MGKSCFLLYLVLNKFFYTYIQTKDFFHLIIDNVDQCITEPFQNNGIRSSASLLLIPVFKL